MELWSYPIASLIGIAVGWGVAWGASYLIGLIVPDTISHATFLLVGNFLTIARILAVKRHFNLYNKHKYNVDINDISEYNECNNLLKAYNVTNHRINLVVIGIIYILLALNILYISYYLDAVWSKILEVMVGVVIIVSLLMIANAAFSSNRSILRYFDHGNYAQRRGEDRVFPDE